MTNKQKRKAARQYTANSVAVRFNPLLKYTSQESEIDRLQQTGASNRKHKVIVNQPSYKPFSNR